MPFEIAHPDNQIVFLAVELEFLGSYERQIDFQGILAVFATDKTIGPAVKPKTRRII